jgi:hypothetical protein
MALIPTTMIAAAVFAASLQSQTPPIPKPFPQPGQPVTAASAPEKPATETPTQAPVGTPTEALLGAPIYPVSEFLESFDAGHGQRYYLFGTNADYSEIVGYYRNIMKNGGRTIFEAPAMQQWELAKFQDQTMSYPPSVVVKDYTWNGANGYLFVDGAKEKRFKTIIQIVPANTPVIK